MARQAVIRTSDGLVVNVIELEPGANWTPPPGHSTRVSDVAGPGDTWTGTRFNRGPAPAPTAEALARASARTKLRGAVWLGLTDAEIDAVTR